ncbi:MAG: hypothetical protein WC787_01120 [Patescibacteria group bacterium]|jgi:hypothetical protein
MKLGAAVFFLTLFLVGTAYPAAAATDVVSIDNVCCVCNPSGKTDEAICLTAANEGEAGNNCSSLPEKYPNLKGMTCTAPAASATCESKITSASGVCLSSPMDAKAYSAANPDATPQTRKLIAPRLNVPIPGLTFADSATIRGRIIEVPFLAQYLAAVYRYLISFAAIAAAIMIVYGGFLYIVAQTGAKVRKGKDIITDALIGLMLVLGAYLILDTLNPALTQPATLRLETISTVLADDADAVRKQTEAAATIASGSMGIDVPVIDIDPEAQALIASPSSTKTFVEVPLPDGPPGTIAKDAAGNLIAQGNCPSGMISIFPSKSGNLGTVSPFCIDVFEAPNIKGKVPYSGVTEWEADWYCAERGKRLCGISEWQRACVGPQGTNTYGYGPNFIEGAYVSAGIDNQASIKTTNKPPAPCNYDTVKQIPLTEAIHALDISLIAAKKPEFSLLNALNPWAKDEKMKAKYDKVQEARAATNKAEPSGMRPCVTNEGVYDMTANVQEIVLSDSALHTTLDSRIAMGSVAGQGKPYRWVGFFWSPIAHLANTKATPTCDVKWGTDHGVGWRALENGFRCCMNLRP